MKSIVLILGTGRSGSTMMDLILGNEKRAISCGEVYAYFRPWRKSHRNPVCSCELGNDCLVFNKMKEMDERTFHTCCLEFFDMDYIIDSSKELNWAIDVNINNRQGNVDVKNLLIYKDPIDLAYSYFKRGRGLLSWRKEFVGYHDRLLKTHIPFQSINYNSFIKSVDDNLKRLCRTLDMPWCETKAEFWNHEYHHFFGSRGTRDQTGKESRLTTNKYSSSFLKHYDALQEQINNDVTIQHILRELRERDFKAHDRRYIDLSQAQVQIRKPLFYYSAVVRKYIKYAFPKPEPSKFIRADDVGRRE